MRLAAAALVFASIGAAHAAKAASTSASAPTRGRALVERSVLPVVALGEEPGTYDLLGNAVLIDDEGRAVTPARVFDGLSADLLLPVAKVGVLVPGEKTTPDEDVTSARVFHRVHVLALDKTAGLALLQVVGGVGGARPAGAAGELGLEAEVRVFGFGGPGITRFVFRAHVAAVLATPDAPPAERRYALDARVTGAADGGVLYHPTSGEVHALTSLHLRSVHRVVHKLGKVEFGPPGTAVGLPLEAVRSWVTSTLPPPAGSEAPKPKPDSK
jgi:hypothetical protein